jgi:alginate O-acetyltransferase complex protein AlgI
VLFFTWNFIALFGICFVVYWSLDAHKMRKYWLLAISYIFYGYWDVRFLCLLIASSYADYVLGMTLQAQENPRKRKRLLRCSIFINLGTLFLFKYFNFFSDNFAVMARAFGYKVHPLMLEVVVPIGISFYTFHAMSYIFDIYNRKIRACESRLDFMLYVAFFPQLLAGPIVRARDFLHQMPTKKYWAEVPWQGCLLLFMIGMIKKTVIGDNIALLIDPVFQQPYLYNWQSVMVAGHLFGTQVYLDFSGYTDMAIATAGLLGFRIPVNFFYPGLAVNPPDFWRRWHISLGNWFRDYVFMPLGGFSRNSIITLRNVLIAMAGVGLWHGAAYHYIVWGVWNGMWIWLYFVYRYTLGQKVKHFTRAHVKKQWQRMLMWFINCSLTAAVLMPSSFFFRQPEVREGFKMLLQSMGMIKDGTETIAVAGAVTLAVLWVMHYCMYRYRPTVFAHRLSPVQFGVVMGILLAFLNLCMATETPRFIYFEY